MILDALFYYRDFATHEDCVEGGNEGAGLDHNSRNYKIITSAIEKVKVSLGG